MIYFTSDLHIGHDKEFLYKPRGFTNICDHDKTLIENWNSMITDADIVFILGDLMLGDIDYGRGCLKQLNGFKYIIIGNHDTDRKINEVYRHLNRLVDINYARMLKYGKYHFFLCHYPTITANARGHMTNSIINLYGHTHQKTNFYDENNPYNYHVGLDSHDMKPVSIDQIIEDIRKKKSETQNQRDNN